MQTAVITGSTAGIGEAAAKLLARNGYRLIITGRRKDKLIKLQQELQDLTEVLPLVFDIRNRDEVDRAVDKLTSGWREIDVLINNAGLAAGLEPLHEGSVEDWEQMIDTNVKGLLYITRRIAPLMIKRGKGHIVNIDSIAGKEVYENGNVYCATKHAVDALSKGMRIDMLRHGIKVSMVSPGMAETEFSLVRFRGDKELAKNPYRGVEPLTGEDVAEAILFVLTRPAHVNINDIIVTPAAQANSFYINRRMNKNI